MPCASPLHAADLLSLGAICSGVCPSLVRKKTDAGPHTPATGVKRKEPAPSAIGDMDHPTMGQTPLNMFFAVVPALTVQVDKEVAPSDPSYGGRLTCLLLSAVAAGGADGGLRFMLGSCNKVDKPNPFWAVALQNVPDAWIWMGDSVYADIKRPLY
ncbi:hypothetical protein T484DRAFT_1759951, partial [Baffinella frigidus]